jgi:seryl-tRNA(Sec) selenium transferase
LTVRFDEKLDGLAANKIQLEYEMKLATMKLVTLFQELIILEAFEEKDEKYLTQLESLKNKDRNLSDKIGDLADRIKSETERQKNFEVLHKDAEAQFNEKIYPNDKEKAKLVYEVYKKTQKKKMEKENAEAEGGDDGLMGDDDDDVASGVTRT